MPYNKIRTKAVLVVLLPIVIASLLIFWWFKVHKTDEDSLVEAKISTIWSEIREYRKNFNTETVSKNGDPQIEWAPKFFDYYLRHPETDLGDKLLSYAFMMWGNTANVDAVTKSILKVKQDSKSWNSVISGTANAYNNSKKEPELRRFFRSLKDKLTSPSARSSLYSHFGRNYMYEGYPDSARKYYEVMLLLAYNDWYISEAKSFLYEIDSLGIGKPAPDFSATDLDGNSYSLSKMKGKVVLLEFWATWCGPCLPEIPYLKKVYKKFETEDFVMIGISFDNDIEALKEVVRKENMDWPQVLQTKSFEDAISKSYNVRGIPKSYIIDKNGLIVGKNIRKDDYIQLVGSLL